MAAAGTHLYGILTQSYYARALMNVQSIAATDDPVGRVTELNDTAALLPACDIIYGAASPVQSHLLWLTHNLYGGASHASH